MRVMKVRPADPAVVKGILERWARADHYCDNCDMHQPTPHDCRCWHCGKAVCTLEGKV
jgi:hypothetical protein